MIQFTEKGMLNRQTRALGERFQVNSPQAQTLRAAVMREQSGHIQTMNRDTAPRIKCLALFSSVA